MRKYVPIQQAWRRLMTEIPNPNEGDVRSGSYFYLAPRERKEEVPPALFEVFGNLPKTPEEKIRLVERSPAKGQKALTESLPLGLLQRVNEIAREGFRAWSYHFGIEDSWDGLSEEDRANWRLIAVRMLRTAGEEL